MPATPTAHVRARHRSSRATGTLWVKRISGPLLDRLDIHVEVPRVNYDKLSSERQGEPSSE